MTKKNVSGDGVYVVVKVTRTRDKCVDEAPCSLAPSQKTSRVETFDSLLSKSATLILSLKIIILY